MPRLRLFLLSTVAALAAAALLSAARVEHSPSPDKADARSVVQLRRPIALAVSGDRLYAANRRSGTLSIIDLAHASVMGEVRIGQQLSDLARLPNGDLLACDEAAGELIRVAVNSDEPRIIGHVSVGSSPVNVCIGRDGSWCSVSLLWAHRVAMVAIDGPNLSPQKTIDLPFAPRKQCLLPDGKTLVVADSFGHDLAVIDMPAGTLRAIRSVEGHNIRGLAISADGQQLLLAHPILSQNLSTTDSNIFWGSVVSNAVRAVELRHILQLPPPAEIQDPSDSIVPIGHWSLYPLGEQGNAAGDPGAIATTKDGRVIVALGGVNEVAVGSLRDGLFTRIGVGRRPTAIALSDSGRFAYVANTLDDSISVIDLSALQCTGTIRLGRQPELTSADRGEILFYDSRLSRDGWFSCNTCHTDGHTSGLLNDNFSDQSFGTPKRILSLLGASDIAPYAWNGSSPTLESQVHESILSTMAGKPAKASAQNVADLSAFIRTLPPPPSLSAARRSADPAMIARGQAVFQRWDCDHCHEPPTYTSPRTYDIELPDELGQTRWNPPSLRGVSQLPAFLHNNRAKHLSDVFYHFKHPHGTDFSAGEVEELVAFLESL